MALYETGKKFKTDDLVFAPQTRFTDMKRLTVFLGLTPPFCRQVALAAGARIQISDKTFLYDLERIYSYLEELESLQAAEGGNDLDADQAEA